MRRWLWPSVVLALVIAYPLLFSTPFQQRLGALVLLYAIAASAWNIVGGYAGQVSVGHVVFFGCGAYAAMGAYAHFGLVAAGRNSRRHRRQRGDSGRRSACRRCGCRAIISAWPPSRSPNWCRLIVTNTDYLGAAVGLERSDRAAQRVRSLLHIGAAVLLSVPGGAR